MDSHNLSQERISIMTTNKEARDYKLTWGTCYFKGYFEAVDYYGERQLVDYKLKMGEINIGVPPLKEGETLSLIGGQYHVTEA